ncbi:MAG: hypothetical protein RIT45_4235 [Pseudomonadota bacterium]|jgi:hypothetical protein
MRRRRGWLIHAALLALVVAGCSTEPGSDGADAVDATVDPLAEDPWEGQESGFSARYDLQAGGWHDTPFPSEMRRREDGGVDLSGFPQPREGETDSLLADYLAFGESVLDGFSVAPTVYIGFDGAASSAALPTPTESLQPEAPIGLVDVDPQSPEYGRRIPLRSAMSGIERGNLLAANLLMAQPTWGAALRPGTSYAFYVRRGLRDVQGRPLGRSEVFARAIDAAYGIAAAPDDEAEARLAATLAPLAQARADGKLDLLPRDLAAATVFRTGHPAGELETIATWLRANVAPKPATGWKKTKDTKTYSLYTATYEAPNFQQGDPPYTTAKTGAFVFDANGDPIVQRTETGLRVAVAVPKLAPGEGLAVGGLLPVVLYSHGTGGSYTSFTSASPWAPADLLCAAGFAVVGIDQPLHGPRAGKALAQQALYLASFNFLNPSAGRTVFRQAVLDNVFVVEMLRKAALDIPASATGGDKVGLDGNRLHFYGHSQGGLVGPLLGSVEPGLRALVLSGAGAGLSLTVVRRKDIVDFPALVKTKLDLDDGELSELHPAVSLIQMIVDAVDPIAYGRKVMERPKGTRPPHVLLTEGIEDEATPAAASEALAVAMGLSILAPAVQRSEAMKALGTPVAHAPVYNNLQLGDEKVTALLRQVAGGSHFTIFEKESVARLAADFLFSVGNTGEAIVENSGL